MPPRQDTMLGLVLGVRPLFFHRDSSFFIRDAFFTEKESSLFMTLPNLWFPVPLLGPTYGMGQVSLHRTWLLYGRMLTTNSGFSPHAKDPLSTERFHGKVSHLYKHAIMCFPRSLLPD